MSVNVFKRTSILPNEYQEVEYIESTGTQYIDSGIAYTDSTLTVDVRTAVTAISAQYAAVFGTTANALSNPGFVVFVPNGSGSDLTRTIKARAGSYDSGETQEIVSDISWNSDWHNISLTTGSLTVDGQNFTVDTMTYSPINNTIKIFARGGYDSDIFNNSAYAKCRISHLSMSINGTLVRDFIPVVRNSDGEAGLYDLVNDVFYTNAGTGTFLKGNDVGGSGFEATRTKAVIFNVNPNSHNLPSEYTQVEYLQSSGTQYIDTGVSDNNGMRAVGTVMYMSLGASWDTILGAQETAGSIANGANSLIMRSWGSNYFAVYVGTGNIASSGISLETNTLYNIDSSSVIGNSYITVNNTRYGYSDTGNRGTRNLYVFTMNNGGASGFVSSSRVYNLAMYNSTGVLVRNFIPAVRNSDSKPGLYDLVNGVFYTNAGSGEFTKGADVVSVTAQKVKMAMLQPNIPSEYQEVEYIEGTGTQWIDTEVKPINNSVIEYELLNDSGTNYAFETGARIGYRDKMFCSMIYGIGNCRFLYGSNSHSGWGITNTRHKITVLGTGKCYIDGVQKWDYITESIESNLNIYLFKFNNNGEAVGGGIGKLYNYRIYNSNILVRNFIPCYRKSDNVIGLYDKVTDTFYTNAGTGDFTKGNNVNNYDIIRI